MTTTETSTTDNADSGFSLIELLVVIAMLGILAVITVFSVRGMSEKSESVACTTDASVLTRAADLYLGEQGAGAVAATGATDDRYEITLINAGFLKQASTYYDLNADGTVSTNGVPCV